MIEITNSKDYIFIKNINDIYKIELYEKITWNNKDKIYILTIYNFSNDMKEKYEYSIQFNTQEKAEKEYKRIRNKIKEEYEK